jgi:hypothetical protein
VYSLLGFLVANWTEEKEKETKERPTINSKSGAWSAPLFSILYSAINILEFSEAGLLPEN